MYCDIDWSKNERINRKKRDPDQGGQVHIILFAHHCRSLRDHCSSCGPVPEEASSDGQVDRENSRSILPADYRQHHRDQC